MAEMPTGTKAQATLNAEVNCVSGRAGYKAAQEFLHDVAAPIMGWNAEDMDTFAGFYVIYVNPAGQPLPDGGNSDPEWGCQQMR